MKRSELFLRVWSEPLTKIAKELGVSDVGVAKACDRYDIPRPSRGHWAKAAVGSAPAPLPLPRADHDATVELAALSPEALAAIRLRMKEKRKRQPTSDRHLVEFESSPERRVRIVRSTARFFKAIASDLEKKSRPRPARVGRPVLNLFLSPRTMNGRYVSEGVDCLRIVATLRSIDWILCFHDALVRTLALHGCKVRVQKVDRSYRVEIHRDGEAMFMSFAEEFETSVVPLRHGLWNDKKYTARDTYKLKIERPFRGTKVWSSDQARLTHLVPEIASDIAAGLSEQRELRRAREYAVALRRAAEEIQEEKSRICLAAQKLNADRKAAQRAQIERAKVAANAYDEFLRLSRLVSDLESRAAGSDALLNWLNLVRATLVDPRDTLLREVRAEAERVEQPLWWPFPSED